LVAGAVQATLTNQLEFGGNVGGHFLSGEIHEHKILPPHTREFCGGYLSNTLLDNALDAAEKYFHFSTAAYKTDSNGYIICSAEKPKDGPVAGPANFQ
jgi:hypothetical protein